jgi:hypothetical protein
MEEKLTLAVGNEIHGAAEICIGIEVEDLFKSPFRTSIPNEPVMHNSRLHGPMAS